MLKLNQDDREEALELLSSHGWDVMVNILDQLVQAKGQAVLTLQDEDRFLRAKAQYDGAVDLLNDVKRLKQIVRGKNS
jgi:hypothetical protein